MIYYTYVLVVIHQVIFKPEEVVAAGAAWHKSCFTCGDGGQVTQPTHIIYPITYTQSH